MIQERDFEGVLVECSLERWQEKLVGSHPELEGRMDQVRRAIAHPRLVLADTSYTNRKHHVIEVAPGLFLDVVVEYRYLPMGIRGRVVTAFLRRRLSGGIRLFSNGGRLP
ncbi:MAG: hypothetical protein IT302_11105 [Dehalococcoidia bacterium]|nr:hypothetical protein [Dehalococcoidia bacterium]